MFYLALALLKPDCLWRIRVTRTKQRRKLISVEILPRMSNVKCLLSVVSGQYVTYLELTRSKSVTSGSQPALHSYLNKPRRSRGKRETLKPFLLSFGNNNVDKCSVVLHHSFHGCHFFPVNIRYHWSVSQGHRKFEATPPPRGHWVEMHTVQD